MSCGNGNRSLCEEAPSPLASIFTATRPGFNGGYKRHMQKSVELRPCDMWIAEVAWPQLHQRIVGAVEENYPKIESHYSLCCFESCGL